MEFTRRISQLLHEDHAATIALIEAQENMIAAARATPPDANDPKIRETLESTAALIDHEVRHHFTFEEDELFTRLEEAGDVGIGMHLREEHAAILPLGERVGALAAAALEKGFDAASWAEFRNNAGELIERMLAHIQKEEMALLPILDDLLDGETDMELSELFAAEG